MVPAIAHLRIADIAGKTLQGRDLNADDIGRGHFDMPGHRSDGDRVTAFFNADKAVNTRKIDEIRRLRQTHLQGGDQGHATGKEFTVLC